MEGSLLFSRHDVIPVRRCVSIILVALILVNVHLLHLLHLILACPPLPALAPPQTVRPLEILWAPSNSRPHTALRKIHGLCLQLYPSGTCQIIQYMKSACKRV